MWVLHGVSDGFFDGYGCISVGYGGDEGVDVVILSWVEGYGDSGRFIEGRISVPVHRVSWLAIVIC